MAPDSGPVDADDVRTALRANGLLARDDDASVAPVGDGVNDVFAASLPSGEVVVKFATFSLASHLRAGVGAYRLLGHYTDLPVPAVRAFASDPDGLPPHVVLDRRPGDRLADGFRDVSLPAVRALSDVLAGFAAVPDEATAGWGRIESVRAADGPPAVRARHDDPVTWLLAAAVDRFRTAPEDGPLGAAADAALEYLWANRDRLPEPTPSVVVADLSPENLLAPGGDPPAGGGASELGGVVDLERAAVGPVEFTAVNAEYLLTRWVDDPGPIRSALYGSLPFGPDVAGREFYRLLALSRSVKALDFWYEPGTDEHARRRRAVVEGIREVVD